MLTPKKIVFLKGLICHPKHGQIRN